MQHTNQFGQPLGRPVESGLPCRKPAKIALQGQYCILEPVEIQKHAVRLFDVLSIDNNGESWTYLPYGPFNTPDEFIGWLEKTTSDNDTLLYVILNTKTREVVGIAGYLRITPEHGVIEIGHLHFSTLLKQTSLATEDLLNCSKILRYAQDDDSQTS